MHRSVDGAVARGLLMRRRSSRQLTVPLAQDQLVGLLGMVQQGRDCTPQAANAPSTSSNNLLSGGGYEEDPWRDDHGRFIRLGHCRVQPSAPAWYRWGYPVGSGRVRWWVLWSHPWRNQRRGHDHQSDACRQFIPTQLPPLPPTHLRAHHSQRSAGTIIGRVIGIGWARGTRAYRFTSHSGGTCSGTPTMHWVVGDGNCTDQGRLGSLGSAAFPHH